jgi:drug/metabolite transporter (DMT)-like permease
MPRDGPLPAREDWRRVIGLGLLGNVAYQLCFVFGIDWTFAGNASLLLATTPAWTLLLSAAAGHEPPTRRAALGVFATLAGMTLVVLGRGDAVGLSSTTLRGDLLMIVAAVLWSGYTVGGRSPIARYGPLRMTAWTLWVGTPVLVILGIPSLARTDLGALSAGTWAGVVYAGLLSIGLAYLLWYRGVQKLGNNRTAVYSNLVPVAALATAWLWLGEKPTALQLLGAAVILTGLTAARTAQSPGPISLRWRSSGNS